MATQPEVFHFAEPDEITKGIQALFHRGDVVEMRIPNAGRFRTISGYFNNSKDLAAAIREWSGKPGIEAVYCTLNPVNPALHARAYNRAQTYAKATTADKDILLRRWLLVDADPVRPAGVSSTDAEKRAAKERIRQVREYLRQQGWPEPIVADSGNGYHLLYLVDLPNDDESSKLLESCLKALAAKFNDAQVTIDETVFNTARICKAYGSLAAKGDNTKDRPHRQARVLAVPDKKAIVSLEKLKALAALAAFAAQGIPKSGHIRPTVYVALIGDKGTGKSTTVIRAVDSLKWRDRENTVSWEVPGSDRGLYEQFKLKIPNGDELLATQVLANPATKLLAQDELLAAFGKMAIQSSTLARTFCELFYRDEVGGSDKKGVHAAHVRLNILGCLKAADPTDFMEVFGRATVDGLHDRFIFAVAPEGGKFKPVSIKPENRIPSTVSVPSYVHSMASEWQGENRERSRLAEIAQRVALITASANNETTIRRECVEAALRFAGWQEAIRQYYRPGMGENQDARAYEAIITAAPAGRFKWSELCKNRNLYRKFSTTTLNRVRAAMVREGLLDEEWGLNGLGHNARTGWVTLKK